MGVVGASLLLAACSSGGGTEPPKVNTPTPERVTVANTPTPEQGTVVNTPTLTSAPARQASPSPVAEAEIREIGATLKNNTFPAEIRVKAGEKVVFVITNEERTDKHSFEFPDLDVFTEVGPLETVRIEWVVPDKKGRWDMGCFLTEPVFEIHERMEGVLIIE
jgi:hypothetical protein